MADKPTIFSKLRDHEVNPPEGLFAKIWNTVRKLIKHTGGSSGNLSMKKPGQDAVSGDRPAQFINLKSYTSTELPPAFDPAKYEELISREQVLQLTVVKKKKKSLILKIAATLIITVGLTFLLLNLSKPKPGPEKHLPFTETSASDAADDKNDSKKQNGGQKKAKTVLRTDIAVPTERNIAISRNVTTSSAEGDFFYILTNISNLHAESLLVDLAHNPKLRLNKYSYVNISDKMQTFLKTMYKVKNNNKPTHKARKAKQKLESWKKQDVLYFDKSGNKNPIDIFDLADFFSK